jgi:hypothetical protein
MRHLPGLLSQRHCVSVRRNRVVSQEDLSLFRSPVIHGRITKLYHLHCRTNNAFHHEVLAEITLFAMQRTKFYNTSFAGYNGSTVVCGLEAIVRKNEYTKQDRPINSRALQVVLPVDPSTSLLRIPAFVTAFVEECTCRERYALVSYSKELYK